jgi:hypothetical protein
MFLGEPPACAELIAGFWDHPARLAGAGRRESARGDYRGKYQVRSVIEFLIIPDGP